jgi:DNA-binding phage protein
MARRSKDWNVGLAADLTSKEFAREFLLASVEDGISIQAALAKVIRAMGVKEFAAEVDMSSPNVLRAIDPRHNPTQATLNRLLKPFALRLSLARIPSRKRKTAA